METPTNPIAARLHDLVGELKLTRADVAHLGDMLKRAQARERDLEEFRIPELLEELGTEVYRLPDGTDVKLVRDIRASVLAENRPAVHAWMDENDHGGLIKRTIAVAFSREQEAAARELLADLRGRYAAAGMDMKIEPATLTAWARRRLEAGEEVPDCVNIEDRMIAKVK